MGIEIARAGEGHAKIACWDSERDGELLCVDMHKETHDVRTFTFVSREGKHFAFAAGENMYSVYRFSKDARNVTMRASPGASHMRSYAEHLLPHFE